MKNRAEIAALKRRARELAAQGLSSRQIAQRLGVSTRQAQRYVKKPPAKKTD